MKTLRVLELFGGIGACSKALERLGIDYEIADYVEIDKYAVKSFNAIHNTNFEPQDICEWDKDIEIDLVMHGSPCQDFSLAGLQAGGDEGSGTRSSLMYETVRIVKKLKPKYVIWENVKNVISKKHKHNFDNYINKMEELGYKSYYQVLNAKDYGIPQNRERVFTISILGKDNYDFPVGEKCENKIQRKYGLYNQVTRWGVYDKNGLAPTITASMGMGGGHVPMVENFEFPPKQELKLKLKDILEENVDEKYYLSDNIVNKIRNSDFMQEKMGTGGGNVPIVKRKYGVFDTEQSTHQAGSVYDKDGLSPTLDTMQGGWRQPCIEINNGTKKSFVEKHYKNFINKNGYVPEMFNPYNETEIKDVAPTQSTYCNSTTSSATVLKKENLRIRKLTPKECWRLMGFDDEDFEKAEKVNSNTQLYKQAGNSIVVNVLEAILNGLLQDYIDNWDLSDLD